eukprot:7797524-Pyramimonas_sp.AAC.1
MKLLLHVVKPPPRQAPLAGFWVRFRGLSGVAQGSLDGFRGLLGASWGHGNRLDRPGSVKCFRTGSAATARGWTIHV